MTPTIIEYVLSKFNIFFIFKTPCSSKRCTLIFALLMQAVVLSEMLNNSHRHFEVNDLGNLFYNSIFQYHVFLPDHIPNKQIILKKSGDKS
jgi:hypothetical protein